MNVTGVLTHRDMLGYWLNEHGLVNEGAEIGCAFGQNAARILSLWKGKRLHMVDPWENLSSEEYPESHETVPFDIYYRDCQSLAQMDNRANLIRLRSVEAAKQFTANSLDFVYIDAAHDYRNVMADMDAWYPKVKVGGLFSGHDFYLSHEGGHFCEVESAVLRWTREHNLVFSVTPCSSWWAVKI